MASAAAVASAAIFVGWTVISTPGASADPAVDFPSDDRGYVNTAAHCDAGQTVLMFGRTARALVAVCVGPDGQLRYRGVRLSDRAGLVMGASRGDDGAIIANNDNVTYAISPSAFLVSEGDTVLYRDTWEEFHQPSGATPTATPSSATPSSAAPSTTAAPSSTASPAPAPSSTMTTPTVSTTTVTLTPPKSSGG